MSADGTDEAGHALVTQALRAFREERKQARLAEEAWDLRLAQRRALRAAAREELGRDISRTYGKVDFALRPSLTVEYLTRTNIGASGYYITDEVATWHRVGPVSSKAKAPVVAWAYFVLGCPAAQALLLGDV